MRAGGEKLELQVLGKDGGSTCMSCKSEFEKPKHSEATFLQEAGLRLEAHVEALMGVNMFMNM